ncbi:MAG: O-antigen ligase family protein [Gammaproteobacteria bacterium]|nr:O-antigen ligase family protein [Gammaproteobacteria bacterium]
MPLKIILVVILTILIVVISIRKPVIGLFFYLALVFIRPQDDRPNIADLHLPYMMMIALVVLYFIKLNKTHPLVPKTRLITPYLYFFFAMSISAYFGVESLSGFDDWKTFVINVITFIFMYSFISNTKDFRSILFLMLLFGLYFCYLAIFNGSDCIQTIDGLGCDRRNFVKVNINFGQPNYLGLTMVIMVYLALPFLYEYKSKLLKLGILAAILLYLFILMKSNSRGAFLAFCISLLYYIFKKPHSIRNYLVLIIIAVISVLFLPDDFMQRIGTLGEIENDESAMHRVELWKIGFSLIEKYPLLGVGVGNFVNFAPNSPHNAYLQVASEMGLISLAIWLWLLFSTLKLSERIYQFKFKMNEIFLSNAALSVKTALIAVLIQGMTTGLAHREFLYILIALVAVLDRLSGDYSRNLSMNHNTTNVEARKDVAR